MTERYEALADWLRNSTEAMANTYSISRQKNFEIWNDHSNAALEAADTLESLCGEVERLREALEKTAAWVESLGYRGTAQGIRNDAVPRGDSNENVLP